jgi:hypothetical protein
MKRISMTNRYICRMYSPSTSESKLQSDINQKVPTSESARNRGFKRLLLEAVDEGLSSLGDSPKQTIYFSLEKTFSIKKQDIPNKIEEFTNAIEKIFGYGANLLEIQIIKHLYKKVGHDFRYFPEKDGLSFTEYVEAASHYLENYYLSQPPCSLQSLF